jgi:hypothetical protein
MADETKVIEAIAGPYKGQRLTLPTADADQAIDDGWAKDPFEPVDPDAEPPEFDQEANDAMIVAAEKAARKMRGEEDEDAKGKKAKAAKDDAAAKDKAMEADKPAAGYSTRSTKK